MGGAGADLTLHTADAIVVRDDLAAIHATIALARQARRVVIANLIDRADLSGEAPMTARAHLADRVVHVRAG